MLTPGDENNNEIRGGDINIVNSTVHATVVNNMFAPAILTVDPTGSNPPAINLTRCFISTPASGRVATFANGDVMGRTVTGVPGTETIDMSEVAQDVLIEPGEAKVYSPEVPRYTVSYHPNGGMGTVPVDMNRYYKGDNVMLLSGANLTRADNVLIGWMLGDGTIVKDPFTMPNHDVALFALWTHYPEIPQTGDGAEPLGYLMLIAGIALAAGVLLKKRAHCNSR